MSMYHDVFMLQYNYPKNLINLSTCLLLMHHPQKNRSTPSKGKYIHTENAQYTSFYDALTHSNNIEYKINQVAQVKLHINPIYKLNSIKKLDKDSLVFHQKRGKAIYFRKKQNKQD